MKFKKKELKILEEHFKIYEAVSDYALEAWTDGGVDMIIYINKESDENIIEQLERYIENFDIDDEIDLYRQSEDYRNAFRITESVKDFEDWVEFIEGIIEELKEVE